MEPWEEPPYEPQPEPEPAPEPEPPARPATPPPAVETLETDRLWLWEGFEVPGRWHVDAADDPGRLWLDPDERTQGRKSLAVEYQFGRKGKVLVGKDTRLNLTGLRKLLVDVYAPADGLALSLGFKVGAADLWYESADIPLKRGWNRDVSIELGPENFRLVAGARVAPGFVRRLDDVRSVYLILHKGESAFARDTALFDNVRFFGTPEADWNLTEPTIVAVYQPEAAVGRYEKFEIGVRIDGYFGNFFDSRDIAVDAVFARPDGETVTVPGFFAGYAEGTDRPEDQGPIWLIRFAPDRVGRYEYNVIASNRLGRTISDTRRFDCVNGDRKGYIRVSAADPRYFEHETGEFFLPIGQNIAWASEFEPYFKRQKETGQNWVRIWLCPWSLWLEPKQAGAFDLEVARRIDRIVELAETYGLHIQLCFEYHGMLNSESWPRNPYNAELGGPCASPADFFTASRARALFKQRLRYIAARWGWSTRIFAWELFNEVDLTNFDTEQSLRDWHREMADYLKRVDAGRHMVTTSFYRDAHFEDVWRLGSIDFTQEHLYTPRIVRATVDAWQRKRRFNKPFFVGEFGRGAQANIDMADRRGVTLHSGLWASTVLDCAGLAAPWWWDKHIQPNGLERMYKPVAAFLDGLDDRRKRFEVVDQAIFLPDGDRLNVLGRASNSEVCLWFYETERATDIYAARRRALVPKGSSLAVTNLVAGRYRLSFVNTYTGEEISSREVVVSGETLAVQLPESQSDLAMKLVFKGDARPRVIPAVDVGRRAPATAPDAPEASASPAPVPRSP
jgi:hypothetical protein